MLRKDLIENNVTIYCDSTWNADGYCIAGVILSDAERLILDERVNTLKKRFWGNMWEEIEIKATDITGRRKGFYGRPGLRSFLDTLWSIIFDEMRLRILPVYTGKVKILKLSVYKIFIVQFNEFLFQRGLKGKIVFDEGDNSFKTLLNSMKEQELQRVFDLCTNISMTTDEIKACLVESHKENALQIADLFSYTTWISYARSPNDITDKIFGEKWLPLPIERLDECYVKPAHNLVVTARMRKALLGY